MGRGGRGGSKGGGSSSVLQQQSKRETRADDDDDDNNKTDKPQSTREREEREERGRGQCTLRSVSGTSTTGKQNVMSTVTQHLERPIIGTQNVMSAVVSDILEPSYSCNLSAVDSTVFRRGGSVPPCQLPFQYWSLC